MRGGDESVCICVQTDCKTACVLIEVSRDVQRWYSVWRQVHDGTKQEENVCPTHCALLCHCQDRCFNVIHKSTKGKLGLNHSRRSRQKVSATNSARRSMARSLMRSRSKFCVLIVPHKAENYGLKFYFLVCKFSKAKWKTAHYGRIFYFSVCQFSKQKMKW